MDPSADRQPRGLIGLTRWALGYAVRRRRAMLVVLGALLVKIGLDVLKPWPMKLLVDNVLHGAALPPALAGVAGMLPASDSRERLLTLCVAGTVVLFLLGWAVGLVVTCAGLRFGQLMVYDLASDLFRRLQRLSLRYHHHQPVGESIRRVQKDCGCVSAIVKDGLLPVLTAVVGLVVMFTIMLYLNPTLTMLSLAAVPC